MEEESRGKRENFQHCNYTISHQPSDKTKGLRREDELLAVFIFHPYKSPQPSTENLGETYEKIHKRRMLLISRKYHIKDPVESNEGVNNHGQVVEDRVFISHLFSEKRPFSIRV